MAVVEPSRIEEFLAITQRWDVEASVLGEVTDGTYLEVLWGEDVIVDVPPRSVAHDGPVYERPFAEPASQAALSTDTASTLARPQDAAAMGEALLALLGSPNGCDLSWVTRQYDRYVRGNTAQAMPDDAGVVRIDETTGRGVAVSTDCNGRYTRLDPLEGARAALAESFRNVAVSGARPIAVSDCLNFGSPEDPDVMWQFERAVEGIAQGCRELGIPVTGGNVSFYNQTGDVAIHPTPVVAVLGVLDDVADHLASGPSAAGQAVFLLGTTREELDGSAWAGVVHDHLGGVPPRVDLQAEMLLAQTIADASSAGLVQAAHDLSAGGLATALAESVLRHGVGAEVSVADVAQRDGVDAFTSLFSESQARALVWVDEADAEDFAALAATSGQPVARLGTTTEDAALRVRVGEGPSGEFVQTLESLRDAHTGVIEAALDAAATPAAVAASTT